MTGRAYILPVALAAAVGLPYVASEDHQPSSATSSVSPASTGVASHGLAPPPRGFAANYLQSAGGVSHGPTNPPYPVAGSGAGSVGPGEWQRMQTGQIVAATPWSSVAAGVPPTGLAAPYPPVSSSPYGSTANMRMQGSVAGASMPAAMLFRFDITPQWIMQTWPQVSTEVSDPPLAGLRTAVVTGTSMQDIAGSMTYYFDGTQQLQRILFHGTTGDPTPLLQMLARPYQLQSEPVLNGAMYVARDKDHAISIVRVRYPTLIKQSEPHQRYDIALELNRPGGATELSQAMADMLEHEQKQLSAAGPEVEACVRAIICS